MTKRSDREAAQDELVWALFGLRVSICETDKGPEREALERRENELVAELADVLDPHAHVALDAVVHPASPPMF